MSLTDRNERTYTDSLRKEEGDKDRWRLPQKTVQLEGYHLTSEEAGNT